MQDFNKVTLNESRKPLNCLLSFSLLLNSVDLVPITIQSEKI